MVYVTTGENYSDPATDNSDAFVAFEMETGKLAWFHQMTTGDTYSSVSLVWAFIVKQFFVRPGDPVSSARPAVLQSRRAQELSRLVITPTLPRAWDMPGPTLTSTCNGLLENQNFVFRRFGEAARPESY
jgi:hypothetical protein